MSSKAVCLVYHHQDGQTDRKQLNKSLNNSLKWSRIGLELALGFLGLLFYKWNESKISCKLTNKRKEIIFIQSVETYSVMTENPTTDKQLGGSLTMQENAEAADCTFAENLSGINETIYCINYLLEKHSNASSGDGNLSADDKNCDISDDEDCVNFLDCRNWQCYSASKHLEDVEGEASFSLSANDLIHLKNFFVCYLLLQKILSTVEQILMHFFI